MEMEIEMEMEMEMAEAAAAAGGSRGGGGGGGGGGPAEAAATPEVHSLHILSENLLSLLRSTPSCSDAQLLIGDHGIHVHRCILSARSAFFRNLFSNANNANSHNQKNSHKHSHGHSHNGSISSSSNGRGGGAGAGAGAGSSSEAAVTSVCLAKILCEYRVEYEAVMNVLAYLYSGRVAEAPIGACTCADFCCSHIACCPAIDFALQMLYCAHVFQIPEIVSVSQRRLLSLVDKACTEDVIPVLAVASICLQGTDPLLARCLDRISASDLEATTLEKELPTHVVSQIFAQRSFVEPGSRNSVTVDIHVRRIHKALDSDDIELVKMLLQEGRVTLDAAFALHYAAAYCDPKTTIELLELGNSDLNLKNSRGFTVLHVAAMRRDPTILVGLLSKGANPLDVTPDGRTALTIAKRLTSCADYNTITEEGKEPPKDRLCIEILEQVLSRDPLVGEAALTLALENENMRTKLLYLEHRVALARLLFPMEAKLIMKIAHVDSTSEFSGSAYRDVDLNESPFVFNKEHWSRYKALTRTVELGKRFFPRCSLVLNRIMDDELPDISCVDRGTMKQPGFTKQRYDELKAAVSEAYSKDKEEYDKSCISSSSSSSSIRDNGCY